MKKIILASLIAVATCSSYAAETVTLNVRGKLTTPACTPTLSNSGDVDFGRISLSSLSATETNQLGGKEFTLTISCDGPTKVGYTTADNRQDTITEDPITIEDVDGKGASTNTRSIQYGLGKTAGGVGIGAYTVLSLAGATIDGRVGQLMGRYNGGEWTNSNTGQLNTSNGVNGSPQRDITLGENNVPVPVAFTEGVFPLRVTAAIQSTETLAITDETDLDGQATITIVYI